MSINPDVCFFHIEKCMGTSMRIMLYNYFKNIYNKKNIYIPEKNIWVKNNLTTINDKNKIIEKFKYNIKILLCHCNFNQKLISENFSERCFSITVVRDPIERIISHYYHFHNKNIYFHKLTDEDTIKECSENVLTLRLSGGTGNIDRAIENINKINCILILENIDDDIKKLNEILNKKYNCNYSINKVKNNINKKKPINILELDKIHARKYSNLIEDIKLYNYILNLPKSQRFKIS
jgi:hypothetical protein